MPVYQPRPRQARSASRQAATLGAAPGDNAPRRTGRSRARRGLAPCHRRNRTIEPTAVATFLGVVAVGSYIQTVTGFALGVIVMGASALFQLAPLPSVAIVISLLGLSNTIGSLLGRFRQVQWRIVAACIVGVAPALALGLWLLNELHDDTPERLRRLLGLFILASGVLLMLRPPTLPRLSPSWAFGGVGAIAGLFGGLFSAPGPPLVVFLYLQPLAVQTVQVTLLGIFTATTVCRTSLVIAHGQLALQHVLLALAAIPVVMLFTWLGRRHPPPLDDRNMRRVAFGLLILLGGTLAV